jgi:chromate reductase, NAD(P)H dehydrogenase (quinone)
MKILAIAGSLRRESHNRRLLLAAAELLPPGVDFEMFEGLKAVPPYDQDDDLEPAPPAVARLRAAIAGADALLIATPEYNSSIPGQLKNALDWASRPIASSVLRNKPVAVVGASKVLGATGARVLDVELAIGHAAERFDEQGHLADESVREQLEETLDALLGAVQPRLTVAAA